MHSVFIYCFPLVERHPEELICLTTSATEKQEHKILGLMANDQ